MYQQVVVLLDGSKLAEDVLPYAIALIRGKACRVYLLSVVSPTKSIVLDLSSSIVQSEEDPSVEQKHVESDMVTYLQAVAEQVRALVNDVQISVRFGRPAEEILRFVEEVKADLVVMSTHGRSGITQWVFGSIADRVLRRVTCPVLLVRAGYTQPHSRYQRILIPLDGSELAEQVLPYTKALTRSSKSSNEDLESTTIFLVSVLTTGLGDRTVALLTSYPPGLQLTTTALDQAEVELLTYLRSVAAFFRQEGTMAQTMIRRGSPADEILDYADEIEADLISMTTHGFSGVSRWVYGNVAGKVLQGAKCPLLLVRPQFK
ncbi:MAG TPA: universal stress protein [Chloroflexi bacterium]|mgnify:CR=1 FL=1|nr:universal stress protein [Chloroflexota bacterium]